MAATKLFGNKIAPACKYCENVKGGVMRDGTVLCAFKGVARQDYSCRRYIYDPLKRIPARPVKLEYDKSDFEL